MLWSESSRDQILVYPERMYSPVVGYLPSLMVERLDSFAQRPLCRLADLLNPFKNVFAFSFDY